jgi:hypothetical protein
MIDFHEKRYPYSHSTEVILENLIKFDDADNDFEPICLQGKYWELIKLDFQDWINEEF